LLSEFDIEIKDYHIKMFIEACISLELYKDMDIKES